MPGIYDNSLRTTLNSKTAIDLHIQWLVRNKFNQVALYISTGSSGIKHPNFSYAMQQLTAAKIVLGLCWSHQDEAKALLDYNATTAAYKFKFAITEMEDYRNLPPFETVLKLIQEWTPKFRAANVKSFMYQGWTTNFNVYQPFIDQFYIHSYMTATRMATPGRLYSYTSSRLQVLAALAKAAGKIIRITPIFSNEPQRGDEPPFGYDYFKTRPWGAAYTAFMDGFNSLATADEKTWLRIDSYIIFATEWGKELKG